ncbi:MAG: amidoligase family protein [Pseudomonadota bacterium]
MTSSFQPLPNPDTAAGSPRKVGVEIEFAGLSEAEAADLARAELGGSVQETGQRKLSVTDTRLGTIDIVLDTALRRLSDDGLVDAGLDAARGLIPVEIVTEPLDPGDLPTLDAFRDTLRQAGAVGTRDGLLLGFGVHLNIEVVAPHAPHTLATLRAFALLEEHLRASAPIDVTRRVMPFVAPWPRAFTDALLAEGADLSFDRLRALYARHCNSRNFALDLLPLLAHADENRFASLFPNQTNTKGRPAYHFRLPDCRIDDPNWSLAQEWRRWWRVETVASQPEVMAALSEAYSTRDHRALGDRTTWANTCDEILSDVLADTAK